MKTKKQKNHLIFNIALTVIIVLFAAANIGGLKQLWGFNFLKFFGGTFSVIALALIVSAALPPVSSKILDVLNRISSKQKDKKGRAIFSALIISVPVLLAALCCPSKAYLLGDANLRLNQIYQGKLFLPTEALDFFLHGVAYQTIFQPLGYKVFHTYWVISAICGLIFTIGVFRLARYMAAEQLWIVFSMMLSSGVLVLFFGYVESYSVIAALLPYICLAGLKAAEGKARKVTYVILCVVGALAHIVALILFLPSIICLFIPGGQNPTGRGRKITIGLVSVLMILVVIGYAGRRFGVIGLEAYLMPLFAHADYQHGIFTLNHWLNLINWILLVSLPVLLLAPYVAARLGLSRLWTDRKSLYALWILVPSCFFVFFFTPQLGGPCDWDLFAIPIFLFIISLLTIYLAHAERLLPVHSVPLVLMSLLITVSFAVVNSREAISIDRYAEVIEVGKFKNLTKQYLLLANTAEAFPETRHRKLEFLHRAWDEPPYTHNDSVKTLADLGLAYLEKGDRERSYGYISEALRIDDRSIEIYQALFRYHRKFGTAEDLHSTSRLIETRLTNNAEALWAAAIGYRESGDPGSALRCLQRASELDPDSYQILIFYGQHLLETGQHRSAIDILHRAIGADNRSFQAHYLIAVAYADLGEIGTAREYLARAKNLQRTDIESQRVLSLEKRLP